MSSCHARADRILIREIGVYERLVYDGHKLTPVDIASIDTTPTKEAHPHRFEVAAGHRAEGDDRRDRPLKGGPSLHAHGTANAAAQVGKRDTTRCRDAGHAWKRRQSIEDRLMSGDHGTPIREFAVRQAKAKRESGRGIESWIDSAQLLEAAHHETRRHEENQRQCHLRAHQQVTSPMSTSARCVASPLTMQRGSNRCRAPERNSGEGKCCGKCQDHRIEHRGPVQSNLLEPWQIGRTEADQDPHSTPGERESEHAADYRDQRAFGGEVSGDGPATGSKRAAYRDFCLTDF